MGNKKLSIWIMLAVAILMAVPAYAYEGAAPFCSPPTVDLTGTWQGRAMGKHDCTIIGRIIPPLTMTIRQTGNTIILENPYYHFADGQICGNFVTWRGSYPELGGTNYVDTFFIEVSPNGKSFQGLEHWVWISENDNCSGTDWFTVVKID